ncbi:MAG: BtpA/SgcQ family protein [Myxococcales bacterium]|nr:BtpA/SgcQ family protein [Myxococcales bacterium]
MLRGIIGVIHLPAMPGDPAYREGGFAGVSDHALRDAEALAQGGVDGMIVENFGSAPFAKSDLPAHQIATLTLVAERCKARFGLPLGVNCLRNDARAALGIAAAAGLDFIRVNVHTGAYVTDQGVIEGEAAATMRYRAALGATGVKVLADVLVKHAAPLAPLSLEDAVRDCLFRGLADGVIVTGVATGAAIDRGRVEAVRAVIGEGEQLVVLGSGVNPTQARSLAPLADAAIVGTWLKRDGQVHAPVDVERVRRLVAAVAPHLRKP